MTGDRVADALERIAAALEQMARTPTAAQGGGSSAMVSATDMELDSQYGDPEVRKDPKRWIGAPIAPCKMSECPVDYLEELASFFDWQAENPRAYGKYSAEQIANYRRKDAAKARGWARRKRAGWKSASEREPQSSEPVSDDWSAGSGDDIPF